MSARHLGIIHRACFTPIDPSLSRWKFRLQGLCAVGGSEPDGVKDCSSVYDLSLRACACVDQSGERAAPGSATRPLGSPLWVQEPTKRNLPHTKSAWPQEQSS